MADNGELSSLSPSVGPAGWLEPISIGFASDSWREIAPSIDARTKTTSIDYGATCSRAKRVTNSRH